MKASNSVATLQKHLSTQYEQFVSFMMRENHYHALSCFEPANYYPSSNKACTSVSTGFIQLRQRMCSRATTDNSKCPNEPYSLNLLDYLKWTLYLQIKVLNVKHFVYFGDYILTITKNKNTCSFSADDRSTLLMSLIYFLSWKDEIETLLGRYGKKICSVLQKPLSILIYTVTSNN